MKTELKKAWVAALRGGEYRQGSGELYIRPRGDILPGYCCLGVLCSVAGVSEDDFIGRGDLDSNDALIQLRDENGLGANRQPEDGALSKEPRETIQANLVYQNDTLGKTFPEIADWIEINIPEEL